jgi:hypothetical protein
LKKFGFILTALLSAFLSKAQPANCIFKSPQLTINFGTGNIGDLNNIDLPNYRQVPGSCPTDGHYSFAPYTSACFSDDWQTLSQDHTPGDANGNMLLVNVARYGGVFLSTSISGLKSNTVYELGFWLMNLCKPTKKCPFLLLPKIGVRLQTPDGKLIANIITNELPRVDKPIWSQYRVYFTTPASTSPLTLVMTDDVPSGCGNDFVLDDITFRECIKQTIQPITTLKTTSTSKQLPASKAPPKKSTTQQQKKVEDVKVTKPKADTVSKIISVAKQNPKIISSTPLVLKTRENALIRQIETETGEIRVDVYDNGEIDGDTVSIYHNNTLIRSHMRLSQKPISFTIGVDPSQPHHEIIMVAENLGSIPPNTSIMIITTANNRYELFISSSEQKNAKVVFDLKR